MTDKERNKIIAEALGLCWHKWEATQFPHCKCKHCGEVTIGIEEDGTEHDFSAWPGFGLIMEKGPGRRWWNDFIPTVGACFFQWYIAEVYLNPSRMFTELPTWLSNNQKDYGKLDETT